MQPQARYFWALEDGSLFAGELTLGQLVAAELIMLAILVGLPQVAGYLDSFFDVCAAVEENFALS